MGCFSSQQAQRQAAPVIQPKSVNGQFVVDIDPQIKNNFDRYFKIAQHIKMQKLFFSYNSPRLNKAVTTYLQNPKHYDQSNLDLCAVDMVCKLHPIDYGTPKVTKEWLLDCCLNHYNFCINISSQQFKFIDCYLHYVQFLYLSSKVPIDKIIIPNKSAAIMWYSHMQNNQIYKNNSIKTLGRILNHTDELNEEQINKLKKQTGEFRSQHLPFTKELPVPNANLSSEELLNQHNYSFINYGVQKMGEVMPAQN